MTTDTPRVAKLRRLVVEAGGPAAFARTYSRKEADKPIDETYVSQILNGHRSFGEKAARNMALRAGLLPNYFSAAEGLESVADHISEGPDLDALSASVVQTQEFDQHTRAVIEIMQRLDPETRALLRGRIEGWLENLPPRDCDFPERTGT